MDQQTQIAILKQRLNDNPNDTEAAIELGNLYYDIQEAAQAIVYYQIALSIKPNNPAVLTDLGTMYWANGVTSYAEKCFRNAMKAEPGFGNAYINLGHLLHQVRGQTKEARVLWQELVDKYPNSHGIDVARDLLATVK